MEKLISVVICSYNHGIYLPETIRSVLNQTYSNIELIVIDDKSTDNSSEIIKSLIPECKQKLSNFIFIEKDENKGVEDTMKTARRIFSGDYIFPVGSDDILKPDAVETLYNFIKDKDEYGFVGGNAEIIDSCGKRCYWDDKLNLVYNEKEAKYKTWADFTKQVAKKLNADFNSDNFGSYKSLLLSNYIVNGYMFSRKAYLEANDYYDCIFEDWYMNLEIAKKYKFKYIDKIIYSYRKHNKSCINNTSYSIPRYYTTLMTQKKYCEENNLIEEWKKAYNYPIGEEEEKFINKFLNKKLDKETVLNTALLIDEKNKQIQKAGKFRIIKKNSKLEKFLKKILKFTKKRTGR